MAWVAEGPCVFRYDDDEDVPIAMCATGEIAERVAECLGACSEMDDPEIGVIQAISDLRALAGHLDGDVVERAVAALRALGVRA